MSESTTTFADLGLPEPLLKSVTNLGYETPSPVQAACIPLLLEGADVLGQAQTGTGKTAAFALPLLARIDMSLPLPQVLVLAPTRELAVQVAEAFQAYAREMPGFHVLPLYGGQSYPIQLKGLKRGPQVVVATPGRLLDHIRRKTIDLSELRAICLDEADEMLRMGFIEDVEAILAETPAERMTALFSATMPGPIRRITKNYMRDPKTVSIQPKKATVDNIEQVYWPVQHRDKLEALAQLLEIEDYNGVIVFNRTRLGTVEVAEKLEARGYSASALNGDMNQPMRERTIARLKSGKIDILVATDVAARGLDVERIDLVVNYDIPQDPESYVHRIGRTGRAGRSGKAILFVTRRESRLLKSIERTTGKSISPMSIPTGEEVTQKRIAKFKDVITETVAIDDLDFFKGVSKKLTEELNLSQEDLTAALLYLAQQERPFKVAERPAPRDFNNDRRRDRDDRGDRSRRNDGRDRRDRDRRDDRGDRGGPRMDAYRIEVGRKDGVLPGNIVGAIANEAGLDSRNIGSIRIHDDYATVSLPEGMPSEVLSILKKAVVAKKPMNMSRVGRATSGGDHKKSFRKESRGKRPDSKTFKKKRHRN